MLDLPTLASSARRDFDLTDPGCQQSLLELTERLLEEPELDLAALHALGCDAETPLEFRIATWLVRSRRFLERAHPVYIGVVFAMWGEHHRLRPRSAENPNGEDALRVKLEQLAWATRGTPVRWRLYAVDDGCPHRSADLAEEIAAGHPLGDHVTVLRLAEALPAADGPLRGLHSAEDSRKGGAILYGCERALHDGADAVVYTDADLSVHLGQLGLLLEPFQDGGYPVVLGNRKDPRSVLVKQEARWGIGIKLLRHMQRMVGEPIFGQGIRDTQAAFKLYEHRVLARILEQPSVYDFSFDTDWILAVLREEVPFTTIPFAFVDSFAESASIVQGPMTTWETLLLGLVQAVRARGVPHDEEMARVLQEEIRSAADLEVLIDRLPPELAEAPDERLGDPALFPPQAIRAWIRRCKEEAGRGEAA